MSMHGITGVMGSGKSHEAMKEKICPALKDDDTRRVITNIEGLNFEAIAEYVGRPLEEIQKRLVHVSYERVAEPKFWYDPESGVTDSVVQPGDLVVIDEMWRYFNRGVKLPEDAMRFFRMHRHYSDPVTGHTCDVVLINQAMRGIHQDIRDVVEVQFNCRKLKVLGRPQNYQVFVIEGGERNASHNFLRKYDPKIFPLYSSYANKNAKELVDKRQSALGKPFFRLVLPLALLGIVGGSYFTYRYFSTMGKPKNVNQVSASSSGASAPTTQSLGQPASAQPTQSPPAPVGSDDWRLVARYTVGGFPVVLLTDSKGRFRTVTSGAYSQGAANDVAVAIPPVEPGKATPWTGPAPTYSQQAQPSAQMPGAK